MESSVEVEADFAVGCGVAPEQWGESSPVGGGEALLPGAVVEDVLDHEGVDVDERGLEHT